MMPQILRKNALKELRALGITSPAQAKVLHKAQQKTARDVLFHPLPGKRLAESRSRAMACLCPDQRRSHPDGLCPHLNARPS